MLFFYCKTACIFVEAKNARAVKWKFWNMRKEKTESENGEKREKSLSSRENLTPEVCA